MLTISTNCVGWPKICQSGKMCFANIHLLIFHILYIFVRLVEALDSDLRQTIAMTTTAMMKTKPAVADPTMSGSCSCHDFGESASGLKDRKWLIAGPVTNLTVTLCTLSCNPFL